MVNGASLTMPYLEPYLIAGIRRGLEHIEDPALRETTRAYCGQEGQHFGLHRRFNETLVANGYPELREIEAQMQRDFDRLLERKPLEFHLTYAAGFETMALAVGHWLVDERERLFGGSDPRVASLILWHFVEEIEHKNAAFDVYQRVVGRPIYRIYGLIYATLHIVMYSRRAYRAMLIKDGLWWNFRSRLRLWRRVAHFLGRVVPHMARCALPGHNPRHIPDPPWVSAWIAAYDDSSSVVPRLDTSDLQAPLTAANQ